MSLFKARIKECRLNKKLTQAQVASACKIILRSYQRYESGDREPEIDKLIALADYFDVSLDYLVGRSDDPRRH